jgi:hypothetical protein
VKLKIASAHMASSGDAALCFNDMLSLRGLQPSREQHRKSRTLIFIAAPHQQFAANPLDKGSNNPHSQSFAGGWIKSFR